jgi:hypothetical protein
MNFCQRILVILCVSLQPLGTAFALNMTCDDNAVKEAKEAGKVTSLSVREFTTLVEDRQAAASLIQLDRDIIEVSERLNPASSCQSNRSLSSGIVQDLARVKLQLTAEAFPGLQTALKNTIQVVQNFTGIIQNLPEMRLQRGTCIELTNNRGQVLLATYDDQQISPEHLKLSAAGHLAIDSACVTAVRIGICGRKPDGRFLRQYVWEEFDAARNCQRKPTDIPPLDLIWLEERLPRSSQLEAAGPAQVFTFDDTADEDSETTCGVQMAFGSEALAYKFTCGLFGGEAVAGCYVKDQSSKRTTGIMACLQRQ